MLQIIGLTLSFFFLVHTGYAQSGAVTSMYRAGGVPPRTLEKLNALEAQYTALNATLNSYNTTLVAGPNSCSSSTLYTGSCVTLPSARRLSQIGVTTTATSGNLTAYSATAGMITRVHGFLNASSGCPTASGWSFCVLDQLRQADALRVSGYMPSSPIGGRYFLLDPNYLGWSATPVEDGASGSITTSCSLMSTASTTGMVPNDYLSAYVVYNNRTRYFNTYSTCNNSVEIYCCKTD